MIAESGTRITAGSITPRTGGSSANRALLAEAAFTAQDVIARQHSGCTGVLDGALSEPVVVAA